MNMIIRIIFRLVVVNEGKINGLFAIELVLFQRVQALESLTPGILEPSSPNKLDKT
jgi:hypothetical protein